jgi:hypothetical protein
MQNHCFTPGARKISPGAKIAGKCVEVLFSRLGYETFRPRRKQMQKIKKKLKIAPQAWDFRPRRNKLQIPSSPTKRDISLHFIFFNKPHPIFSQKFTSFFTQILH